LVWMANASSRRYCCCGHSCTSIGVAVDVTAAAVAAAKCKLFVFEETRGLLGVSTQLMWRGSNVSQSVCFERDYSTYAGQRQTAVTNHY
jgi:hypothetical protein